MSSCLALWNSAATAASLKNLRMRHCWSLNLELVFVSVPLQEDLAPKLIK